MKLRQKWHPAGGADGTFTAVRFSIASSGGLAGAPALKTFSGNNEFDRTCIEAINQIGSLPALPAYMNVTEIPLVGKFHAGKGAWVELKLEEELEDKYLTESSATGGPPTGATGQSGWTQPSGSAPGGTGMSGWTQPSAASSAQQNWSAAPPAGSLQVPPEQLVGQQAIPQTMNQKPVMAQQSPPPAMAQQQAPPAKAQSPQGNSQKPTAALPGKTTQPAAPQATPPNRMEGGQDNSSDLSQRVVLLNNNAVVAIADNNYEVAIKKLEEALKIDPAYQQARANLAIAYNNYGLQLKDRPEEAIKIFHKAIALDPANQKTKINLDTIIQYLGKNPKVFKDRLDLGNRAIAQGDTLGARIEYEAALALKPDPIVQQKLYALMSGTSPNGTPEDPNRHKGIPQNNHPKPMETQPKSPAPENSKATKPINAKPGKAVPKSTPQEQGEQSTAPVAQSLDTMYRNLKNLEIKTFGKPFESDDILSRLSRLEQKLMGKTQQGKPMRRLDALLMLQ